MAGVATYTGTFTDAMLLGLAGMNVELTFTLDAPAFTLSGGQMISTQPVVATPDAAGKYSVKLVSNADIVGDSLYLVRARFDAPAGGRREMDLFWFYARPGGGPVTPGETVPPGGHFMVISSTTEPSPWPRGYWWFNPATGDLWRVQGAA